MYESDLDLKPDTQLYTEPSLKRTGHNIVVTHKQAHSYLHLILLRF